MGGVPAADVAIFQGAAAQYGLGDRGPSILAAINYIESTFDTSTLPGVHSGTNRAGAAGPMQIGVDGTAGDTWDTIKVNAPGDPPGQPPNVYDEADAVYSAANYLHNSGAPGDWPGAIFTYNHSSAYVQQVLSLAAGYYSQGLTAQGSAGSPTITSSGVVTIGSPFAVRPARGDLAGPMTLAQLQPAIVAASVFTDRTGAWGDDLTVATDSYAELSPGIRRSQVTKQNATMLGGLPYLTPLQVTNPHNGRSVILYKRDTVSGGRDDLDVVEQAEQHRQSVADDRLVVCDQDADGHPGTSISTRQPSVVGPADIMPPARSIRSRRPSSPWPPPIPWRGPVAEAPLSTDSLVRAGS